MLTTTTALSQIATGNGLRLRALRRKEKEELENGYKGWQLKLRLDQNKDKKEGGRK